MGLGGVAIAVLPSVVHLQLTFSDRLGGRGNGKGWQIGENALPGKGKGIGRYWCDEKVGYWAREEKEMCPGGATCLPLLGNVLAPLGQRACPKTGQKTV